MARRWRGPLTARLRTFDLLQPRAERGPSGYTEGVPETEFYKKSLLEPCTRLCLGDDLTQSCDGRPAFPCWPAMSGRYYLQKQSVLSVSMAHQPSDIGSETHLRVVLWLIVNHPTRIGDAPELAGVVGNPVEDMKWHTVLIVDPRRLNGFAE